MTLAALWAIILGGTAYCLRKPTIVARTYGLFIKRPEVKNSENELRIITKMEAHAFSLVFLWSRELDTEKMETEANTSSGFQVLSSR